MSLSGILKLTGRIPLLLLLVFMQASADNKLLKLNPQTKAHINRLYAHRFIHDLLNSPQYQDRYLEVLFQHFRADFQDWPNSHWPILLQDIGLLPIPYCTEKARQDHGLMRDLWERQRDHLQADPIDGYHETMVRVPLDMDDVFQHDTAHYHWQTRSVLYEYLVREMQRFAEGYPARDSDISRQARRNKMTGKLLRFKAIYWLTVLDQFIGSVQLANAQDDVLLANPFPRTVLRRIRQDPVAQQADPMLNPLAQAGPSGSNAVRRAPSAAAGAPSRATHQGGQAHPLNPGPRAPPPGYPRNPAPRAPPPPYPHNPGPDPNLVAQHSPRVGHVAAPVAGPVIVHWKGQYASPQQAPGPRAPPPAYPHYAGPRAQAAAYPHQAGPRAPPPAYPHQAGPRAPPPAYPHQAGPRAPPPAYPHNSGPRAPPPAYPHNPGPRAPPPAYPHQVGPRVGPVAQPMAHPLAQPGPSGSNPGKRAPSPNRGTKRKGTDQGGGQFQGGGKRGPGGAMRSMDSASNESQVGPQAQQSNSGGSSTALPSISLIMVTIAVSLISFA